MIYNGRSDNWNRLQNIVVMMMMMMWRAGEDGDSRHKNNDNGDEWVMTGSQIYEQLIYRLNH
jgi:hypothetical protein